MTRAKKGVSPFKHLLDLSRKYAELYGVGLDKVDVEESPDGDTYVVIVRVPDESPSEPPAKPARKRAAKKAPASAEPTTQEGTGGEAPAEATAQVADAPPVPRQARKRAAKKAAVQELAPTPAPQSGSTTATPAVPDASDWMASLPNLAAREDWDDVDLDATAYGLSKVLSSGLPNRVTLSWHEDVLDLQGIDLPGAESCVRVPQSVSVAPETAEKGYPVILFRRGDVRVVLGFRNLRKPKVIAVYPDGDAFENYRQQKTGGGGKRKAEGPPRTVATLLSRLKSDLGCEVNELATGTEAQPVKYKDENGSVHDLGKVNVKEGQTRPQIASEYERFRRKVEAVNKRVLVSA